MSDNDSVSSTGEELGRDRFLRWMVRDISGVLQDVIGTSEAEGYVSVVGDRMGSRLDEWYTAAGGADPWTPEVLGEVLVDLKRRIGGDFEVVSGTHDELVFENSRCPFGDDVLDRPSLCMMTSNVFGRIGANHFGEVSVDLIETIAEGHGRCLVRVAMGAPDKVAQGTRHYFSDE